jgi:CheY-like chemotaxis protein
MGESLHPNHALMMKKNITTDETAHRTIQTLEAEFRYATVMLIDDNTIDTFIHKKLIESNHFAEQIQSHLDAREALEFLKNAPENEWPELILLDIMMPGMDGFEFLEAFANLERNQKSRIKVILLSTSESFKDLNRANKNSLVKKFLNKPLTPEMLNAIRV